MSREVSCTLLLLEVPDLDKRIGSSSTEDKTVRVELAAGETMRDGLISHLTQQFSWEGVFRYIWVFVTLVSRFIKPLES